MRNQVPNTPSLSSKIPTSLKEGTKNKKPNTINEKHNEIMNIFEKNDKEKIPRLLEEIQELKKEIVTLVDINTISNTYIEKSEGGVKDHDEGFLSYSGERLNPTSRVDYACPKVRSKKGFTGGFVPNEGARRNIGIEEETSEETPHETVTLTIPTNETPPHDGDLLCNKPSKKKVKILLTPYPPTNITNMDKYIDIYEQIISKKAEIKKLNNKKKNYYLENAKCIFHYFEQKKNISTGGGNQNTDLLNNFFKIKTANNDEENIENNEKYRVSKYIYQNYWKNVNGEILNMKNYAVAMDICHYCNSGEFIHQEEEGVLICNNIKCGKFVTHIVDGSKPFNKEPPNEVSYTAYIRLNHFKEILSQFQAKETTQIPPEVIDMIRARIKKERITDLSKLNYEIMRDILRKLGLNKYFEHIQYINSIFGVKPPVMSEALIETLCVLFIEIQPKFSIYCPANRTNLLSYSYILHQLCVLLDQKQYLPYITTLKDIDKQRQNDVIWYSICKSLDWQYFPTI